jgi:hypothetical protein
MKRIVIMALGVVLVAALSVSAQTQIEGKQLRVNTTGYLYAPLVDAAATGNATTWSLDSAGVDTSYSYKIIPGVFAAVQVVLDAAADSLDQIYIDGSQDGTSWLLIDSIGAVIGTTPKIRYIHGPANGTVGAATPVLCRYLRFRADNDDGAGAATVLTGRLVTSSTE